VPAAAPAPTRKPHPEVEEAMIMATAMKAIFFGIFYGRLNFKGIQE